MRSGQATKMLDTLYKNTPEYAQMRYETQRERLKALRDECPDRIKIVHMEHVDQFKAVKGDRAAFMDLTIKLVEEDKIKNPDRTDFAKFEEEEIERIKNKRFEQGFYDLNDVRARTRESVHAQKKEEGDMLLICLAVGVAASAAGAGSLAIASFGTAFFIADCMKDLEPARNDMLRNAQELTRETYHKMMRAEAQERGVEAPSMAR